MFKNATKAYPEVNSRRSEEERRSKVSNRHAPPFDRSTDCNPLVKSASVVTR
jgi:hypothetical protein